MRGVAVTGPGHDVPASRSGTMAPTVTTDHDRDDGSASEGAAVAVDDPMGVLADVAAGLAGELPLDDLLDQVVEVARDATGAGYAALGVIGDDDRLVRFLHAGIEPELVQRIGRLPRGEGVLGLLIRHPETLRLEQLSEHPASVGFPANHPHMTSFLGTPVRAGGTVFGNLYLADKPGGFDDADEQVVEVLAVQVGSAIQTAILSHRLQRHAIREERDRISRDLHDTVIQTLFSVGMSLDATRGLVDARPDQARDRIDGAVDAIDSTIRDLRETILDLRGESTTPLGLRAGLVELAREHEVAALVRPRLVVSDGIDHQVPANVVPDVLAVVREALGNAGRHSSATAVEVDVRAKARTLQVRIRDDGVGFDTSQPSAGHGLVNVRERAALHRGSARITSGPHGTDVTVLLPLADGRHAADPPPGSSETVLGAPSPASSTPSPPDTPRATPPPDRSPS